MKLSSQRAVFTAVGVLAGSLAACKGGDRDLVTDAGHSARPWVAQLESLRGEVALEQAGVKRAARVGGLADGEALVTGATGEATLVFEGGRKVEVGNDARVVVRKSGADVVLEVERGLVLSRVEGGGAPTRGPPSSLVIETPFGLTRLGGAPNELALRVSEGQGTVDVKLGQIQWVARDGGVQNPVAGESLSINLGKVVLERSAARARPGKVAATGRAELRRKDDVSWKALPRRGVDLGAGDRVRVLTGESTVSVEDLEGRLAVGAGAEVEWGGAARNGAVEEATLELVRGSVGLHLAPGRTSRVRVGSATLEASEGGFFRVERTREGLEVSALAGDARLTEGDHEEEVRAGKRARLGRGAGPALSEEPRPEVEVPTSSRGVRVFHPGVATVGLTWGSQAGDFRVEVARDRAFTQPVLTGLVHRPFVEVSPPLEGALFWRVRNVKEGGPLLEGSAHFGPEPPGKELGLARNEVPEGTEKTTIFFQDRPPAITFLLGEDPTAGSYEVRVFDAADLSSPVAERRVTEPRWVLEAGVLREGSYVWSSTPIGREGEAIRGGRMNKLEMVYDNSVPDLEIRSPSNRQRVSGGRVKTTGTVPVGAALWVNGREVPLDEKHRFDVAVAAAGKVPILVYRVVRPAQPEELTVRVLKRSR